MSQRFDWEAAYARLDRARQALDSTTRRSPEEAQRLLRSRAERLARPRQTARPPTAPLDLLVFSTGGEQYGLDVRYVLEVFPLGDMTPVPGGAPAFLVGVVNLRGRILPVLNLHRLLGVPSASVDDSRRVVAVEAEGKRFGLAAAVALGTRRVDAVALTVPASLGVDLRELIRGITEDLVTVLDLAALARDPRILIG
jgi:purine-binding chemotaxis protein CheW